MTARRAAAAVCLLLARPLGAAEGPAAEVATWLTGTFAAKEPGADGEAIRIVVVAVPKSRLANGAPVLYREQAVAPRFDEPTLQRFYRVEEDGGVVRLRAFDPRDPLIVRGKWRDPSALALYGTSDVREKPGCEIALRRVGARWVGATPETPCPSNTRGAVRTTSTMTLSSGELVLWDRGFDESGKQAWGSPEGGITFVKRSASAPLDDALQERVTGRRAEEKEREKTSLKDEEGKNGREQEEISSNEKEEERRNTERDSLKVEEKEGEEKDRNSLKGEEKGKQPVAQAPAVLTIGSPSSPSRKIDLAALRAMAGNAPLPVSHLFPNGNSSASSVVVVTARSGAASVFSSAEIFSSLSPAALDVSSSAPRLVAPGGRGLDDVVSIELRVLAPAK